MLRRRDTDSTAEAGFTAIVAAAGLLRISLQIQEWFLDEAIRQYS
jgi:hypothetical protein